MRTRTSHQSVVLLSAICTLLNSCSKEPGGDADNKSQELPQSRPRTSADSTLKPAHRDHPSLVQARTDSASYPDPLSPGWGTQEARVLLALLKDEGIGSEAVPEAYAAALDYQSFRQAPDGDATVAGECRAKWERLLAFEHGLTNRAVLQRIFELAPTVPWGPRR